MPEKIIEIEGRKMGLDQPCFIVAEAGINHNGDINIAKKMIDIAKECGVDAVKFQTFKGKEIVRDEKEECEYESRGKKVKESMLKMYERYEFKEEDWRTIKDYCQKKNLIFFSTPQNLSDLNLLLEISVPAIKVGSDDLVNLPLLEKYAQKGLPMIISTGMGCLSEIDEAVRTILKENKQLIILHCVSSYPAEAEEINLYRIKTLQKAFPECIVGFSDHSIGKVAALGAVALGAKVIEKHFTLDHQMEGPDHVCSAEPQELKELVRKIRYLEKALGNSKIGPSSKEEEMRKVARRSIVAALDIQENEELSEQNLTFKRPGTGLPPKLLSYLLGKKAKNRIKANELITFDIIK